MYSSLTFFIFSMLGILGFYLLPVKIRSVYLIGLNAYFCCAFGWKHFLCLIALTLFSYAVASCLKKRNSKFLLFGGISVIAASLFLVKFGSVFGISSVFVPIGYSFYTLQAISFLTDIYQGKIAEFCLLEYLQYMTYFPILLQGPICRFQKMRQQFACDAKFNFEKIRAGVLLMLFGLIKKVVIADRLSIYVSDVFNQYTEKTGGVILIAVVFYAFQLYTDFSGCTDISRGVSECLGIYLPNNFNTPYFSLSIKEFWNNWHLSLSTWLRDYVYIPLGGNRKGTFRKMINLTLTFLVSGLWHGTGLQYLIWGGLQAAGQIVEDAVFRKFSWLKKTDSWLVRSVRWLYVWLFTLGSWLIFRAHGVRAAVSMLIKMLTGFMMTNGLFECGLDRQDFYLGVVLIVGLVIIDALIKKGILVRQKLVQLPYLVQCLLFMLVFACLLVFGIYGSGYNASDFIYMQF
ncbi:MAG: MBOAT family protein [Erysipelotrichaceae bacterium]|nr:MBOAT family protein [Erysipelotrichaceae bacterium]